MSILPSSVRTCTVAVVGAVASFAAAAQNANPVGDWALVSMTFVGVDTGEVTRSWGANPVGQLTQRLWGGRFATCCTRRTISIFAFVGAMPVPSTVKSSTPLPAFGGAGIAA